MTDPFADLTNRTITGVVVEVGAATAVLVVEVVAATIVGWRRFGGTTRFPSLTRIRSGGRRTIVAATSSFVAVGDRVGRVDVGVELGLAVLDALLGVEHMGIEITHGHRIGAGRHNFNERIIVAIQSGKQVGDKLLWPEGLSDCCKSIRQNLDFVEVDSNGVAVLLGSRQLRANLHRLGSGL